MMIRVYSKLFMEQEDETWSARPSQSLLQDLHRDGDSVRWIAILNGVRIALGDPVHGDEKTLYLPQWIMDIAGMESTEEYNIEFHRSEELEKATRLVLKIIGDIPQDIDIKELLEEPLSQLGVLEEGQILPMPVLEGVQLLVTICEPTASVFLDGEAALEIETDDVIPSAPYVPSAPSPHVPYVPVDTPLTPPSIEDDFSVMPIPSIPTSSFGTGSGTSTGTGTGTGKTPWQPFQGVGRRLCD